VLGCSWSRVGGTQLSHWVPCCAASALWAAAAVLTVLLLLRLALQPVLRW
jgi:hypothetical protein